MGNQPFDSEHTGLDHVSFMVGSRDDLVDAMRVLGEANVEHGEVTDLGTFAILSFSDPDGVYLELTATLD